MGWSAQRSRRARERDAVAERALRESEERLRTIVEGASDVVLVLGADGTIRTVLGGAEQVLGHAAEVLPGRGVVALAPRDDAPRVAALLTEALERGEAGGEWRVVRGDGTHAHVEARARDLVADPRVGGLVLTLHDTTERKAFEEQLRFRAFHDPLTQLPNRALFGDRVEHALAREEHDARPVAVLFVDLHDFKVVNDTYGHAAGDELLVGVAKRLRACLRSADTAARRRRRRVRRAARGTARASRGRRRSPRASSSRSKCRSTWAARTSRSRRASASR